MWVAVVIVVVVVKGIFWYLRNYCTSVVSLSIWQGEAGEEDKGSLGREGRREKGDKVEKYEE